MRRVLALALSALAVAACGSTARPRVWVTSTHHRLTACVSNDCGPYAATIQWQGVSIASQTGYLVFLNGVQIADVASSPYVYTGIDCGTTFTFGIEAHDGVGGTSSMYSSSYTSPSCGAVPSNTAEPVVSGTVATGQVLSTTNGSWANNPTGFTYQWQDCGTDGTSCSNIVGQTNSTYTVASGDAGHTIEALVTAANGHGSSSPAGAPIVPLVDELNGSSIDPNVWATLNEQGDTSGDEFHCFVTADSTESGGSLTQTAKFDSGGLSCPAGTPVANTTSSLSTGSPITTIPETAIDVSKYTIPAGTVTLHSGAHTQDFTTTGATSSATTIPVTSQTPNFAYPSGSQITTQTTLQYESGAVQEASTAFTFGTITVRAKLSGAPGTSWPAIWLLGASCQSPVWLAATGGPTAFSCPWSSDASDAAEIDIAEGAASNSTVIGENVFNGSSSVSHACTAALSDYSTNFHTYELDWTSGSLVFKIDGSTTSCGISSGVPSHPMFLIIETAICNEPTGGACGVANSASLPQTSTIDWVHVSH